MFRLLYVHITVYSFSLSTKRKLSTASAFRTRTPLINLLLLPRYYRSRCPHSRNITAWWVPITLPRFWPNSLHYCGYYHNYRGIHAVSVTMSPSTGYPEEYLRDCCRGQLYFTVNWKKIQTRITAKFSASLTHSLCSDCQQYWCSWTALNYSTHSTPISYKIIIPAGYHCKVTVQN